MAIVPTNNGSINDCANDLTQLILDLASYFARWTGNSGRYMLIFGGNLRGLLAHRPRFIRLRRDADLYSDYVVLRMFPMMGF